ncbi:MAG TPA: response regulator [Polyangiaceae bacterium]|nr:response regulator [Polyangiaceae bacterium]
MPQGKILVVEDEPAVGRALARSLEREGYVVDVARTHADSLTFTGLYDVGVFDIELPDSDGVELAKRLVARNVVRQAVFFSGLSDGKSEARARSHGAYVHKSEGMKRLFTVISGLIRP